MERFFIDVDDALIADLHDRVARTRWPDAVTTDWSWGTPPGALRELADHWRTGYDWSATQRRLNAHPQILVDVDGERLHVLRAGTPGTTPLFLLHGWPDAFIRFEKVLPLLGDRFDLVVPSLPGFGFSPGPANPGWGPDRIADALAGVADELGMASFVVHGADVGSTIAESLAARHPDRVLALHLGDVPAWHRYQLAGAELAPDEKAYADQMATWFAAEGAYAMLHRTKPQTLAYALADSPVALAAWFVEKLRSWSDGDGPWGGFTRDEVLDLLTIAWATGTGPSSVRHYRDAALHPSTHTDRVTVPTGFTLFPRDIALAPRVYAERFFDVRHYAVMPRGGHFGPWEEPRLFADDLRAFVDAVLGSDTDAPTGSASAR
ncbi:MAG: epoxide hydrolase [Microbacterium sp.]|uniref:epoxide hydrolase family protein n=1 Tax=Microbacterium sp. TaxID=51671 RepID=UPI00263491AC|nr:epoxide hydrolase family protein [Microbacterium sp.]MCX6501047.1 epoxide hydrolase [Microbacterium sp.]